MIRVIDRADGKVYFESRDFSRVEAFMRDVLGMKDSEIRESFKRAILHG